MIMGRNPISWSLWSVNDSSYITKQYFTANGDRLNNQITKLMHFMTKRCAFLLSKCSLLARDHLTCQLLL